MIVIAVTSPAHAQSTEIYTGSFSTAYQNAYVFQEIVVYQGQGQICWTALEYEDQGPSTTPDCTTSSTLSVFFPGDTVTFMATGMNGYVFDHWITPDKDTYTVNPIAVTLPMPVLGNPMAAVFVKGTSVPVPEFPQVLLMLGSAMILGMTMLRRRNTARG
jgi:hypothetical protein